MEEIKRYWLNDEKTSWVDEFMLPEHLIPDEEIFEKIWDLHPPQYGKTRFGPSPRWFQSYGKGYYFSGTEHKGISVPKIIQPWIDHANESLYAKMYGYSKEEAHKGFNEVLINWYKDGNHYIAAHSDNENQLVQSKLGETIVWSSTFQEGETSRIFRLKPIREKGMRNMEKLDIEMPNGVVLVMGGACQKTHKHQIPKTKKTVGRRINLTFRRFN